MKVLGKHKVIIMLLYRGRPAHQSQGLAVERRLCKPGAPAPSFAVTPHQRGEDHDYLAFLDY